MNAALILAFAILNLASDELVLRDSGLHLRLTNEPCRSVKVLNHISVKWHPDFRHATLNLDGRDYAACWVDDEDIFEIMTETGGSVRFPKEIFKRQRRM